jgi:putative ATP-binding cassette transporter
MNLLVLLLRGSFWLVAVAGVAGILSGAASAVLITLIQKALARQLDVPSLAPLSTFIGLSALLFFSKIASETLLLHLAQTTALRLRTQLSERLLAAPLRTLEKIGPARLLSVLTEDIAMISNALGYFPILATNAALIFGCLIYLGWLSWRALLWILLILLVGLAVHQAFVFIALRFVARAREEQNTLYEHFRAMTEGTKELKIHRRRRKAFLESCLGASGERFRRLHTTGVAVYFVGGSWGQLLFFLLILVLLFPGSQLQSMSGALRASFVVMILFLMAPLEGILSALPTLGRARVALKSVEDLGLSLTRYPAATRQDSLPPSQPGWRVELVGVKHSYYEERSERVFTMGPIDLSFTPGQVVFLIGGNGSGKTTLLKVLTGLYTPEAGQVLWNGVVIDDSNRDSYREFFSVVYSDFFLFEQLLGLEKVASLDESATQYLKQLELNHKVQVHEGRLSTTALSQGQRKRLALLVAYLEDRPFYIFDEWAADQDPAFKDVFYKRLLPALKQRGKTALVISHDDHYYHLADRLIKLDSGRLEYDRAVPE